MLGQSGFLAKVQHLNGPLKKYNGTISRPVLNALSLTKGTPMYDLTMKDGMRLTLSTSKLMPVSDPLNKAGQAKTTAKTKSESQVFTSLRSRSSVKGTLDRVSSEFRSAVRKALHDGTCAEMADIFALFA